LSTYTLFMEPLRQWFATFCHGRHLSST